MTLLYDRRAVAERPVEPIRWRVRGLVLLRSLVGQGRHQVLARWPIGPDRSRD
jgi:2'-5' RNA ligase